MELLLLPTLEGQYIIKNLMIISAVIGFMVVKLQGQIIRSTLRITILVFLRLTIPKHALISKYKTPHKLIVLT